MYQRLALSPYLFSVLMNQIKKNIQDKVPLFMMFADDVVLVGANLE
jgi:hypothetical protein